MIAGLQKQLADLKQTQTLLRAAQLAAVMCVCLYLRARVLVSAPLSSAFKVTTATFVALAFVVLTLRWDREQPKALLAALRTQGRLPPV